MGGAVDDVGFNARLTPDRVAVRELASGRNWTYGALDRAIGQCAAVLAARNIGAGDRVAALSRNRAELILLHLACARIGALFVPLNWRLAQAELARLIADAEPSLLVGDATLAEFGLDGLAVDELAIAIEAAEPLPSMAFDRDRPSLILYTSGTSGRPKGVLLTERNIDETAINFSRLGRVTRDSIVLSDSPMFHVIGIVTNIRPALLHAGSVLVSDGFEPARTLDRMGDPALGVTHYFCVPQMAETLRTHPDYHPSRFGGLVALFTGGSPHPAPVIRAWLADGVPVADGYGLSEAGTVFGMPVDPALIDARAGSSGIATPRVQSRIVAGDGSDCEVGEAGELLLKGANISAGYWRRPEETAAAFTADGWFRTGDIARMDAEGYHWIVDRKKDMFISGGENVYPAEIESVVADHPHVAEAAVVGVADARWGEVGHLFVVARPGAAIDREALVAHCGGQLARYKIPKHVSIVDALPRNGAGKVVKAQLLQLLG